MRQIRRRLSVGLLLIGLGGLLSACSSSGSPAPVSIDGTWAWQITAFGCPVASGVLNSIQQFTITDDGESASASFTDSAGNTVTITGTYANGLWRATIRVETTGGRVLTGDMVLEAGTLPMVRLDGPIQLTSDTDGSCDTGSATVWMTRISGSAQDVFTQCGPVDIVIMMDTSGSMEDEADALCEQVDGVLARMAALGLTDIRLFKWGITEDADAPEHVVNGDFACLEDNVREVFGDPIVPGTKGRVIGPPSEEGDEDWGPGVTIVSHLGSEGRSAAFQWRPQAVKIIVPISDEGPSQGDPADEPDDAASIALAIQFATANGVLVSPIVGTGAEPPTAEHARNLAQGTGGRAFRTTQPGLDFGQVLFDIVFVACGGVLEDPEEPPAPGPSTLVAMSQADGLFELGASTGAETKLFDVAIAAPHPVNGMTFNERTGTLWANASDEAETGNTRYSISPSGVATLLTEDTGDPHLDLAQRRSDRLIFATDDDDDIDVFNSQTAESAELADDISFIAEVGNGLTFVGADLYLASGAQLWMIDPFSGTPTLATDLTVLDPPEPTAEYSVISMTTRPEDGQIFCLLREVLPPPPLVGVTPTVRTYLATLNLTTGDLAVVSRTSVLMDGIAWVPADYFTSPPD